MSEEIDHSPLRLSAGLALVAAAGTVGLVAQWSPAAGVVAIGGLALVALGTTVGSVGAVVAGSFGLFGGVVLAGLSDAGTLSLLLATLGAILAWDLGEQAVTLGRQVGRGAKTGRGELVHAGASLLVGIASVGLVGGVSASVGGGFRIGALVVLLVAGIVLVSALRP